MTRVLIGRMNNGQQHPALLQVVTMKTRSCRYESSDMQFYASAMLTDVMFVCLHGQSPGLTITLLLYRYDDSL